MVRRASPVAVRRSAPPPREGVDRAILDASRAVIELFLRERTSAFSVKELAAHAGISERTFYRYFPRKEDAIRPYVGAGIEQIVAHIRDASDRPLREAIIAAHAEAFQEARGADPRVLLAVLNETESLRAVWLRAVTDAEDAFAEVVAERLGIHPGTPRARMAASVVVTAGRLALEQPFASSSARDPAEVFAECLTLLGPTLFE